VIHNAEPDLADLLQSEQRGWRGPSLPAVLLALLNGAPSYKGSAIVASVVRRLDDGTALVSVRRRGPIDALSKRELEVARAFASGRSHKEIAESLDTSPATVRGQLQAVYGKVGVTTKVALLRRLLESE
jgi:DNA-binding NarL/FixJ family response regulator